jgi:phosphate-selective porin OprO/OprP
VADLERRIRELETIVRRLEAERHPTAPAPAPAQVTTQAPAPAQQPAPAEAAPGSSDGGPPSQLPRAGPGVPSPEAGGSGDGAPSGALAGWDNDRGFFLRSQNGWFNLRLTGQLQGDYRAFLDGRDYTDPDSFLVRRARLGIEADVAKYYEFRLLPDFSNGQNPNNITAAERIQDAYMNVHYWDCFQIETGKFKQPFSYEQLIQDRFVPTAERSLIDQLVPARDEGVMIHGYKLLGGRLDYQLAVSNGENNGDYDTNIAKDFNVRLAVRPFQGEGWLHGLQLGISGGVGKEEESVLPNPLRMPDTVPFLQFNSTVRANGLRERYSPEVVYFHGPLGLAAQYFRMEQHLQPTFVGPGSQFLLDVPFTGYYVLGTYLITGESRTTYSMPIKPFRPFDPCHPCEGTGAWELVGRVSRLNLGEEVFEPLRTSRTATIRLANPALWTRGATEMTLGFNWYLNAWVRMQFNWEHDWFDSPVRLGPGPAGLLNQQDVLISRLQFIF